ncbi:MAG: biotin--[acetyl-CoA-carboxylase] ligase [Planctomycetota bacterium]
MRFRCIEHGAVDSTSERAFAALTDGTARHGDVHFATSQSAGRGRRGRSWWSPPGEGLYASLVLLPPPPPWNPVGLTMAGGLAVLDAARACGLLGARLDWPNDLVAGDSKLAGVLVETKGFVPETPHYVVGLGLNVGQREFPAELRRERAVASLRSLGLLVSVEEAREAVLLSLASRLEQMEGNVDALAADYLLGTGLRDRRVRVRFGDQECLGKLDDLTVAGGVALSEIDGKARSFPLEIVRELVPCL